jgi:hypothetical protein
VLHLFWEPLYEAGYNYKKPWMSNFNDDWFDIAIGEVRNEIRRNPIDLTEYLPKHMRNDKHVQRFRALQKECSPFIVTESVKDIKIINEECPICFDEFNSDYVHGIVTLPKCGHIICARCISAMSHRLPKSQYLLCCLCRQSQEVPGRKKKL